jgi:hypothetical protein
MATAEAMQSLSSHPRCAEGSGEAAGGICAVWMVPRFGVSMTKFSAQSVRAASALGRGSLAGSPQKTGSTPDPVFEPATLADAGIDKHLADRARKLAASIRRQRFASSHDWSGV